MSTSPPVSSKTILCVDDTPYVLQMLEMFLKAVGYQTVLASNGGQAISLASSRNLDAVILDYEMPNITGLELAQILRQSHPKIPILMYSARLPQTEISAAGVVDAYVEKENPQVLVMELARLLGDPTPILIRRRFPRYTISSTFTLRPTAPETRGEAVFRGIMRDLAEGGCGGVVNANIVPGEVVTLEFGVPQCDATLAVHARVRYRTAELHGFEFVDLTATQQRELRRCVQSLSMN